VAVRDWNGNPVPDNTLGNLSVSSAGLPTETFRQRLAGPLGTPADAISIEPLPGDASSRSYCRVSWPVSFTKPAATKSAILMVMASQAPPEEGFTGSSAPPATELPFIDIQRLLSAQGIGVPEILHDDAPHGWLLLEDLGDVTLLDASRTVDVETLNRYYEQAIDILVSMQLGCTEPAVSIAHRRAFDPPLFVWEFDHFIEYGIEARNGVPLPQKVKEEIRAHFSDIALRLASLPQVFTHRDYHSRNLMVQGDGRIRVIDFQDALMGPCQYDLASLLRDAYIDLPEPMIDRLIAHYLARYEQQSGRPVDAAMFRELFDLVSLQRNLKAAGRFVYIDRVKKNPKFLASVPAALAKAQRNLAKYPRLDRLYRLLAEQVKEWQ